MAKKKTNKENDPDRLRLENELKKNKLREKGAVFSESSDSSNLSPEIESEFLKNIEQFENAYATAERVSVYEFIGKPDFKKPAQISDSNIEKELVSLMKILNRNGIVVETLCDVKERVLYAFITEELFLHEIDNIRVEGMILHFIYEEFHPNHEYDIRNHSTDFMRSFLDKQSDYYSTFLTKKAEEDKIFKNIRDAFKSFTLKHFDILSLTFTKQKAKVIFNIDFTGIIENSNEQMNFTGKGSLDMVYKYNFWCVQKLYLPKSISN